MPNIHAKVLGFIIVQIEYGLIEFDSVAA